MADIKGNAIQSGYSGVTHNDIAALLGKTFNAQEQTLATTYISSIERYIASKCRRNFKDNLGSDSYYDIFDAGRDGYTLFNYPISEVKRIVVDGVDQYVSTDSENSLFVQGQDFFVHDFAIQFATIPHSSVNNRRALKIYYTIAKFWGDDVVIAVKMWVSQLMGSREYGNRSVKKIEFNGFRLEFKEEEMPQIVKSVIENYRKVLI